MGVSRRPVRELTRRSRPLAPSAPTDFVDRGTRRAVVGPYRPPAPCDARPEHPQRSQRLGRGLSQPQHLDARPRRPQTARPRVGSRGRVHDRVGVQRHLQGRSVGSEGRRCGRHSQLPPRGAWFSRSSGTRRRERHEMRELGCLRPGRCARVGARARRSLRRRPTERHRVR